MTKTYRDAPASALDIAMAKKAGPNKISSTGITGTNNQIYIKDDGRVILRKNGSPGAGDSRVKMCVQENVREGMSITEIKKAVSACGKKYKKEE